MSRHKDVRIIRTELSDRLKFDWITPYRVEVYAPGLGYYTTAGFPSMNEAKQYRRKLLRDRKARVLA